MTYAETLLPEFDAEMASTRKVLERVPEDKLDWRAHPKSNTIGWNANHLAEIPGWVEGTLTQTSWDFSPPGGPPYTPPSLNTRQAILNEFDANVAQARTAIQATKDDTIDIDWTLLYQGDKIFTSPRRMVNTLVRHESHHPPPRTPVRVPAAE
jgi:hypothetical protein